MQEQLPRMRATFTAIYAPLTPPLSRRERGPSKRYPEKLSGRSTSVVRQSVWGLHLSSALSAAQNPESLLHPGIGIYTNWGRVGIAHQTWQRLAHAGGRFQ